MLGFQAADGASQLERLVLQPADDVVVLRGILSGGDDRVRRGADAGEKAAEGAEQKEAMIELREAAKTQRAATFHDSTASRKERTEASPDGRHAGILISTAEVCELAILKCLPKLSGI